MTGLSLLVQQLIHQATPTCSRQHSDWSVAPSSRSRAAMTLNIPLFCRPQEVVWVDKHLDRKSQVLVTTGTASFGPATYVAEVAQSNMVDCTRQHMVFNRRHVAVTSKVPTRLASGVTGVLEMEP